MWEPNGAMRIAVASGKGGTGKTIVATNLAVTAAECGQEVTCLDCDKEGCCMSWLRKQEWPWWQTGLLRERT